MPNNTQIFPTSQISSGVTGSSSGTFVATAGFGVENSNLFNNLANQGDLTNLNNNSFFYLSLSNPLNWNQYFPYQLMILQDNSSTRSPA
jgi:hypothetical protein